MGITAKQSRIRQQKRYSALDRGTAVMDFSPKAVYKPEFGFLFLHTNNNEN